MIMTEVLNSINTAQEASELNVLIAIGESYQKALSFLNANEYTDESIKLVQESFIMEDAEISVNTGANIKDLFRKIIDYLKKVISKITEFFNKKINKYEATLRRNMNLLRIFVEVKAADYKKIRNEIKNAQEAERIAKFYKKDFKNNIERRELTKNDIKNILRSMAVSLTEDEFKKMKDSILNFEKNEKNGKIVGKDVYDNLVIMDGIIDAIAKAKSLKVNKGHIDKMKEKKNISDSELKSIRDANINKLKEKHGTEKIEMDLKLIENFSNTMGKALDHIGKSNNFSYENMCNMIYGGKTVKDVSLTLCDAIGKILKRSRIVIPNLHEYGDILYEANHDVHDYLNQDMEYRRDLGIKLNASLTGAIHLLNNIKEETYGWEDDFVFNYQTYTDNNPFTRSLGGPFTISAKMVMYAITKDVVSSFGLGEMSAGDIAWQAGAMAFKSTPSGPREERKYDELKSDDKIEYALPKKKELPLNTKREVMAARSEFDKKINKIPLIEQKNVARRIMKRANYLKMDTSGKEWDNIKKHYEGSE